MHDRSARQRRAGALLVWVALVLPLLLGMVGLVVDAGLLMAGQRHLQNAADAAAMAAAKKLQDGESVATAQQAARKFVRVHHKLSGATVTVNSPPASGPYAGETGYVEVLTEHETPTIFMSLLGGVHRQRVARARAVSGSEEVELLDGIFALDPRARSGFTVTGNARFRVTGRVIVNSEGGGMGTDGERVPTSSERGFAAFVSPFAQVEAEEVYVVGGVNRIDRFLSIDGDGSSVLKTGQLPIPDPLAALPTPTVANGVVNVHRGNPFARPGRLDLANPNDDTQAPNRIDTDETSGEETMVLHPGIYESIDISGGRVRFEPGIYVIASPPDIGTAVRIVGGEIEAQGVMFYNTRRGYDPVTGLPDRLDGSRSPSEGQANAGQIRINADLEFSGINTALHHYADASPLIAQFNGMLIYQRRASSAVLQLQGFAEEGDLIGAIYARWAPLRLPASGVFHSRIVVGALGVPGHGDLLVRFNGEDQVKTRQVFLVE